MSNEDDDQYSEFQDKHNNNSFRSKSLSKSKPSKQKIITILDIESNPSSKQKINSPRSLEAIKHIGYNVQDLYHLTFDEFKRTHPEMLPLSQEFQEKRYNFYENNRNNKIKEKKSYVNYI